MQSLANLTARIAELEARLENILQLAKVTEVDDEANLLDLEIRGEPLKAVPYLTWRAGEIGKTYWVPEVGEVGMLLSPAGDVGNSIFLPAHNYSDIPAPDNDKKKMHRIFDPDARETWDDNDNTHLLRVSGNVTRQTERDPGKIKDTAGPSEVTLLESGNAKIAVTPDVKVELQATQQEHVVGANVQRTMTMTEIRDRAGPLATAGQLILQNGDADLKTGLARVHLTASGVTVELSPTISVTLSSASIRMRHGLAWITLLPTGANVNGATFTSGATNLFNSAGVVAYGPIPG